MHIEFAQIFFYILVALTLGSALLTVMQNHPVRSVLFLVLTFFFSAILWMLLEAEFLSLILVLVYVGAVMTLFLFVVMMLNVDVEALRQHLWRLLPLGILMVGGLSALFMVAFGHSTVFQQVTAQAASSVQSKTTHAAAVDNTQQIGEVLFTQYVYPFELAAVLLLIAMIAAITLVHRAAIRSKRQNVRDQIMTQASDRVRLVSFPSSKDKS